MTEARASLGQRLQAERERKGLSAQKVADALHLDGWVVEALESEDYRRIGPSVYVKGHLKRYAEILGLPAAEILAMHAAAPIESAALEGSAVNSGTHLPLPLPRLAAMAAAAVLVVVGVLWWPPWHPRRAVPTTAKTASAASDDAVASSARADDTDDTADTVDTADTANEAARSAATIASGVKTLSTTERAPGTTAVAAPMTAAHTTAATAAAAAAATISSTAAPRGAADVEAGMGRARLRLSFSADSWVDVRDALGQRIYAGNGHANSVKTVAGAGPLRVYLGSANGVQLEINHHAVAIAPQYVVGNAAHFEAGADGVLRRDPHPDAPRPRG